MCVLCLFCIFYNFPIIPIPPQHGITILGVWGGEVGVGGSASRLSANLPAPGSRRRTPCLCANPREAAVEATEAAVEATEGSVEATEAENEDSSI